MLAEGVPEAEVVPTCMIKISRVFGLEGNRKQQVLALWLAEALVRLARRPGVIEWWVPVITSRMMCALRASWSATGPTSAKFTTHAENDHVSMNSRVQEVLDAEDMRRRCEAHGAWMAANPDMVAFVESSAGRNLASLQELVPTRRTAPSIATRKTRYR